MTDPCSRMFLKLLHVLRYSWSSWRPQMEIRFWVLLSLTLTFTLVDHSRVDLLANQLVPVNHPAPHLSTSNPPHDPPSAWFNKLYNQFIKYQISSSRTHFPVQKLNISSCLWYLMDVYKFPCRRGSNTQSVGYKIIRSFLYPKQLQTKCVLKTNLQYLTVKIYSEKMCYMQTPSLVAILH